MVFSRSPSTDSFWLEDEHLTVLQQSSVLEFSFTQLNDLEDDHASPPAAKEKHQRRCVSTVRDSASSDISIPRDYKQESLGWAKKEDGGKKKSNKTESGVKKRKKGRGWRSWSGSPDWDFMEGCSYDAHRCRASDELQRIQKLKPSEAQVRSLSFSGASSSGKDPRITENALNNRQGKDPIDASSYMDDYHRMDSAREVGSSFLNDMSWDASPPFLSSSLYGSWHSKRSESSSASVSSHSVGNDELGISFDPCFHELRGGSFLERVKNELDIELLEETEEATLDNLDPADVLSCSHGSTDDPGDHYPKSSFGRFLNLFVGIGVGAMFQIIK